MRIGIDARELQGRPTGTGRYLRNLIRIWDEECDDELVAYFNGPAPAGLTLPPRVQKRGLGERPCRGLWWQERLLPRAVRKDQVDVLFCPAYTCPLSVRVPRVTTVHDLSFFSLPHDFTPMDALRRRLLVSASVKASKAVIAVSDFTRREILGRFPELEDRVFPVPEGPDDDLPLPVSREEARRRLDVSGPFLLTVGSVLNRRCLPEMLRAVARLARRRPALLLDVVGDNRTHPPLDLGRLAGSLGLESNVRVSGFVSEPELALRYAAADVAVFLSEYEGFGLPVLEAMSRGVPVIAANRPAVNEIFGEAVRLVDPRDVSAMASAIDALLESPERRGDLVTRGRRLAARFSWREAARRTHEILYAVSRQ